ncbi:MAG: NAD(P)H-dependent oxidoreductase subunit E [Oscillospiraceae bacterium]|nr:NAD(P)H-dependent oxidoreductase subunit E [Oscillospiraceae bacterium]
MKEMLDYYRRQGAPGDQTALVGLLKELQQTYGAVPKWAVGEIAEEYKVKESFILAVVKRIPSLRLQDTHLLQMCAGPNCGKHTALAAEAEKLCKLKGVELKYMGCQRMCGKGPNIRFDGKLYHKATVELLQELLK